MEALESFSPEEPRQTAARLVALSAELGKTVGTAESLTAGMIASTIADIPGASRVLMGGIVSYDPRIKQELLAVPQQVIDTVGVVSRPCAVAMADGARSLLKVDYAVSATGLAGPGGGTEETPVGTVFIGAAGETEVFAREFHFTGDRAAVRAQTTLKALKMLIELMEKQR